MSGRFISFATAIKTADCNDTDSRSGENLAGCSEQTFRHIARNPEECRRRGAAYARPMMDHRSGMDCPSARAGDQTWVPERRLPP